MPTNTVVSASLSVLFFLGSNIFSSQPVQGYAPRGAVVKAGPAFSWLKRLDRAELTAVNERCQKGKGVLSATNETGPLDLRILGGQLASVGQFRYAVALGRTYTYIATCGATLISPRHLLTAAHCVPRNVSAVDEATINQTVRLGGVCFASSEDGCPAPDMLEVEMELAAKVYYSRSARDTRTNDKIILYEPADLALIQLRHPIDRHLFDSGRVGCACLPPSPSSTPLPASLVNIGWGLHSDAEGDDHYTAHLRFVRLLTRPRDEWSPEVHELEEDCQPMPSPRFCQYPPGRAQAAGYFGDSGSGAFAVRGSDGAPANTDVLYGVVASGFNVTYSLNESDWQEPYAERIVGNSVSVQYHLDELCYYLHLGCGVHGITGVGTTLRLSSFYLKRKRGEMPSIAPFTLLSDEESLNRRDTPGKTIAALVDMDDGGNRAVICLAMVISSRHLIATRACIMGRYLRAVKEQSIGGGMVSVTNCVSDTPSHQCTKRVEFIAWQRITAALSRGQQAAAGSDLAIVQLATTNNGL